VDVSQHEYREDKSMIKKQHTFFYLDGASVVSRNKRKSEAKKIRKGEVI
jgi:hypothetical protein